MLLILLDIRNSQRGDDLCTVRAPKRGLCTNATGNSQVTSLQAAYPGLSAEREGQFTFATFITGALFADTSP